MLHGSPKTFLDMLKNWNVCNTAYSKYSRSVLEVGLKLHRILYGMAPDWLLACFTAVFIAGYSMVLRGYLKVSTSWPRSAHGLHVVLSSWRRSHHWHHVVVLGWRRSHHGMQSGWPRDVAGVHSVNSRKWTWARVGPVVFPRWPRITHEIKTCWHQKRTKKRWRRILLKTLHFRSDLVLVLYWCEKGINSIMHNTSTVYVLTSLFYPLIANLRVFMELVYNALVYVLIASYIFITKSVMSQRDQM